MNLFSHNNQNFLPLAEKLRPQKLDEILGQKNLVHDSRLGKMIRAGQIPSMILWGPPGSGKTSFALSLAQQPQIFFESLNAVEAGVKQLKEKGEGARDRRLQMNQRTLLFVDEIHRFNKSQQDVLLPFVERGDLILVGATTENPSYELNRALLSRCRVIVFEALDRNSLLATLKKVEDHYGFIASDFISVAAIEYLFDSSDGDARKLLNSCELLFEYHKAYLDEKLDLIEIQEILQTSTRSYDKSSENHYDVVSAFIKSVRGSDPDAALYYLARMIDGGEDPIFIARRLIILASEDIGNADPRAITVATAAAQAIQMIGLPEGLWSLAQATTYLSCCPKSNASYKAIKKAMECVQTTGSLPVPLDLRSSKTGLAKELGYGENYLYPHDQPRAWVSQSYLPEALKATKFYENSGRGFEKNMQEYLDWLKQKTRVSEQDT